MCDRNDPERPITNREFEIFLQRLENMLSAGAAPSRLLSVSEACARLSISRGTLYTLFKRQELRPCHVGRSTKVSESDVEDYIRNRKRT